MNRVKLFFLVILGSLFALQGCAADTCATNADCSSTEVCVDTGGVLFSARECIPTFGPATPMPPPEDMAGDINVPDVMSDVGEDMVEECVETNEALCERAGATCGLLTAQDLCGTERTVSCGVCELPDSCTSTNTCACEPETDAGFCARLGKDCGRFTGEDNCRVVRTVECGTCESTVETECGANEPNVCGCPCNIDGKCYPRDTVNPLNSCEVCDPSNSSTQWSLLRGSCDDGNTCTSNDTCREGVCVGTQMDCSILDSECSQGVCNNGSCTAAPIRENQACGTGLESLCAGYVCTSGLCALQVTEGMCYINGSCYTDGQLTAGCCRMCDADADQLRNTLKPIGTPCGGGCSCTEAGSCRTSSGNLCLESCAIAVE